MNKNEMIPGKRYSITINDCCIQGTLRGRFVCYMHEIERVTEDGFEYEYVLSDESFIEADLVEGVHLIYLFDIGTLEPDWGQWYVREIR